MRVLFLLLWFAICVGVILLFCFKVLKDKLGKLGFIVLMLIIFAIGSKIINLNTLSKDLQTKVDKVTEACGDTYISTKGDDIYIKVNNEWLNVKDIAIIGDLATKDITIQYEGREIYIGESGVKNTIKTMEAVGLIDNK